MKQWQLRSALSHLRDLDGLGGDLGVDDRDRLTEVSDLVEGTAATEVTLLDAAQLAGQGDQRGRGLVGGHDLEVIAEELPPEGGVGADEAPLAAVVLGLEVTELPGLTGGGLGGLGVFGACHE